MPMLTSAYLEDKCARIEKYLEELIPADAKPKSRLWEAARYSLLAGGKRLRPVLVLASAEALGASQNKALPAAAAVELVHTYSLIHDDLPCMDDDDFRRGKPSLHKAFSEAHAVLAGDFLLTYAFELLSCAEELRAEQKVQLIALLAKSCGGQGMISGQAMDIEAEGQGVDLQALQCIHRHKTGALITASVLMGAVVADAAPSQVEALKRYGDALGLAFQIMDDILDVRESVLKHGKAVSSDQINNKSTYVSLMGIEAAEAQAGKLVEEAKRGLLSAGIEGGALLELADFVLQRNL